MARQIIAAILEAARQRASKAGDVTAETAALRELEALRRAYCVSGEAPLTASQSTRQGTS